MPRNFWAKSFVAFLAALLVCHAIGVDRQKSRVLYISSYDLGYDWTDLVTSGVIEVLGSEPEVEVFTEFMDAKRYPVAAFEAVFLESLRLKFTDDPFDALLCSDNAALDFVLERREDPLFQGVPIVFCGITNTEDYRSYPDLYGVKEEHEFERLVEAIHRLMPEVKRLHVLLNNEATGRLYREQILAFAERWRGRVEFVFHFDHSIGEITSRFGALGPEEAVYTTVITVGRDGEPVSNAAFMRELVRRCPVPVFGDLLANGSEGLIGGPTNNAEGQGALSARMVLDLLDGREIRPRVVNPTIEWRFDYRVVRRFGLDPEKLPKGAWVENIPEKVFQRYKVQIIAILSALGLLSCTVFLLSALLVQKRRHEKELRVEKEKAEESDRLKSLFLANISHEIRTPLNAMIGLSSVLGMNPQLDDESKGFADRIIASGFTLRDTISNILEYSRIESGDTGPVYETYPFSELLNRLWSFEHWANINRKRVRLENRIPEERLCRLDIRMAQHALGQVMHNALKFSGESPVSLECWEENGIGIFVFEDEGCGIAPVDRQMVFKPFAKGTQTENGFHPGAGLGLSIAKEYVEKLGGSIALEFDREVGTRAVVRIPLGFPAA